VVDLAVLKTYLLVVQVDLVVVVEVLMDLVQEELEIE
jgi:hypothetical protein